MTLPTFPTLIGLTFPYKVTPMWSTIHQLSVSGKDSAVQLWTYPRRKYELSYDMLRSDVVNVELQTLIGFFNKVGGSAKAFHFTDPDDSSVTAQPLGVGDGVTTAFQLVRSFGGFTEPVFGPSGTPTVYVNGTPTTLLTISATGLVTFTTAPAAAAVLTWTGTYDWLCRFDDDSNDFEKFMSQLWQLGKITFTTIKV
jgi:uncharacterized protein (TIGR02217 family)